MLTLSWDINSFGFEKLPSICLTNSYFAFGAQFSNCFPHLMAWAFSTVPFTLPDTPAMGLTAHTEQVSCWILILSLPVLLPMILHSEVKDQVSLLCCCCILSTSMVPDLVEAPVHVPILLGPQDLEAEPLSSTSPAYPCGDDKQEV